MTTLRIDQLLWRLRGFLVVLVLVAPLCVSSCHAQTVTSLPSYATLQTVARIDDDTNIQHRLQQLLGADYQSFVSNFDVWGEPRKLSGGGLLVEAWLRDLYFYEASVFAIYPDGRIYAARADVADKSGGADGTIRYYSNDVAFGTVTHPTLAPWIARFRGATTVFPGYVGGP